MDPVSLIIGVLIGAVIGSVVMYVARRGGGGGEAIRTSVEAKMIEADRDSIRVELEAEREARQEADRKVATLTEREQNLNKQFEQQRASIEEMRKQLLETFDASSRKALQDNSERFLQQTVERLKPLREQLEQQNKFVRELEKSRAEAYGDMGKAIAQMMETHKDLRSETSRLTTALRRPDQRGKWGEVQLRRVVELAGMTEHCDFVEQPTIHGDESSQRPDLIVNLPGGGRIVVDAKTPLDAYLDAIDDETTRDVRRAAHADAMQGHWKTLAKKSYWEKVAGSPDLVVMFIPVESALMAAMDLKPTMHADAMAEHVLIATPTLLVGLLRSIAFGWRQEALAENAREIAAVGKELYERLSTFVNHHATVGKRLESAVKAYNESVGSLERRLLVSGRRLHELGVQGEEIEQITPVTLAPQLPASAVEPSPSDA
ncbi:MAG TPA: DNA recombination protein RmuC [Phycisphaerales bacterium]|nr:DNA recombination protein RmuC [Phycisphaerales bacterium]